MNGDELYKLRFGMGLTQDEFAEKLGMSASMVCLMENGKRPIGTRTVKALELLQNQKAKPGPTPEEVANEKDKNTIDLSDIHPLTGFLRDHKFHLERLHATGRPEVLTVNGRARVVVQDAEAYQKLMDVLDGVETEKIVCQRIASLQAGEEGVHVGDVLSQVRARFDE